MNNQVVLTIPELKIPAGYIYKGDVLLGAISIPEQDIVFKDVQIDASALVDEIVRRVVAEVTAIILGLPAQLVEQSAQAEKASIEQYVARRRL